MPKIHATFKELQEAIQAARGEAERDARRECGKGFVKSRGTWLVTSGRKGLMPPRNENYYNGQPLTAKEVNALIADVEANYPEVDKIDVDGGFDFAESLAGFNEGDYDAWVSEWSVTVWTRTAPTVAPEVPAVP